MPWRIAAAAPAQEASAQEASPLGVVPSRIGAALRIGVASRIGVALRTAAALRTVEERIVVLAPLRLERLPLAQQRRRTTMATGRRAGTIRIPHAINVGYLGTMRGISERRRARAGARRCAFQGPADPVPSAFH
jgi:hypothetical protein